jgi:ribosomal protein L9
VCTAEASRLLEEEEEEKEAEEEAEEEEEEEAAAEQQQQQQQRMCMMKSGSGNVHSSCTLRDVGISFLLSNPRRKIATPKREASDPSVLPPPPLLQIFGSF